jgi:hypothetical protein
MFPILSQRLAYLPTLCGPNSVDTFDTLNRHLGELSGHLVKMALVGSTQAFTEAVFLKVCSVEVHMESIRSATRGTLIFTKTKDGTLWFVLKIVHYTTIKTKREINLGDFGC